MYLKQIFHVFPHKTVLGEKTWDKEISLILRPVFASWVTDVSARCIACDHPV